MRACLTLLVVLLLTTSGMSQVADGPSKTFSARDLFDLRVASDPQVRPDGGAIAYVRVTYDIFDDRGHPSIWLIDPETGVQSPVVVDRNDNRAPRWSPDGQRLAYVSNASGEGPQLYVRWMANGHSARIATLEHSPNAIEWSPDGSMIAFTMLTLDEGKPLAPALTKPDGAKWAESLKLIERLTYRADGVGLLKPGYRHVFVVAADGGAPRQVTFGRFDDQGPISFDRDGLSLVFSTNRADNWERNPHESDIYRVSIADGALTRLTSRVGPDRAPVVSPDGSMIGYTGYDDHLRAYENEHLYVMNRDGSNPKALSASLDRTVEHPTWAADGRSIYVSYVNHGVTGVSRVWLDGRIEAVASALTDPGELDRPYAGGQFSVGRNGLVAFTQGAPDRPAEIALAHGTTIRTVTRLNDGLLAGKTLAHVEALPVTSSYDKLPIDAWLVEPPNFDPSKKHPLILEIHGGPFESYGPTFSTDYQLYASAGYMVVYSNPRGSTSYGEAFANYIDRAYPGHDYDDLMSVVDAAIATGTVDPEQLYVTGGSGGGVLTAWIVGKTKRFRAAVAQKPVINWTSEVLTVDVYNFMAKYWFGKMPWENPQAYWNRSPLSLVGNVSTPTLVVVGEEDLRTPPSESEQFYQALQLRGVPTALLRVPGASHGSLTARPSQSAAKAQAILGWFERYRPQNR
jgi:dipeptidyl aminopeptidase/acylaminoacyl peptidase